MSALQVAIILSEVYYRVPPKALREQARIDAERRDEIVDAVHRARRMLSEIPPESRNARAWSIGMDSIESLRVACRRVHGSTPKVPVHLALEKVAGAIAICLIHYTIEEAR